MKNKIRDFWRRLNENTLFNRIVWPFKRIWGLLSHNFGLKILSLLMAILLWNYVISTNTSITRTKTITGLTGYISGQATLNAYGLALLDESESALNNISVKVEVPQMEYSRVTSENVQVTLDLSSVRTAGTQEVPLKAVTSYGRVMDISPETLTLTFETLDSRSIPVNYQVIGEATAGNWYNVNRINPSVLTISGAASVVRSIASANVYVDITGLENTFTSALPYVLLDANGEEIAQTMLNRSSSSISVSVGVYPTKELPVSTEIDKVVTGQLADGYEIQSVTIQPETITVAADGELLESLNELVIEPISVDGLSQSFSVRASVSTLSDFRYVSNEQVYVTVTIVEETDSAWVEDVNILFSGKGEGLNVTYEKTRVYVTGPKSEIEKLQEEGLSASVDLTDLEAGNYELPLVFDAERYPEVTFQPETEALSVTLTSIENDG